MTSDRRRFIDRSLASRRDGEDWRAYMRERALTRAAVSLEGCDTTQVAKNVVATVNRAQRVDHIVKRSVSTAVGVRHGLFAHPVAPLGQIRVHPTVDLGRDGVLNHGLHDLIVKASLSYEQAARVGRQMGRWAKARHRYRARIRR